jgi:hypothetical protein
MTFIVSRKVCPLPSDTEQSYAAIWPASLSQDKQEGATLAYALRLPKASGVEPPGILVEATSVLAGYLRYKLALRTPHSDDTYEPG